MTQDHLDYYKSLNIHARELSITLVQERFNVSWSEAVKIVFELKAQEKGL